MTRINCIDVEKLSDKHLVAEYREMLRLRHVYPRQSNPVIPSTYRLGKGHITFFYNKGLYLLIRHSNLREEMRKRGFKVNFKLDLSSWPESALNDWEPTIDAKLENVCRIINRTVK